MVFDVMCTIPKKPQPSDQFILRGMTSPALPGGAVDAVLLRLDCRWGSALGSFIRSSVYYELVLISSLFPNWGSDAMLFALQIVLTHASNLHE